jgi:hypothetical protein
MLLSAGGLCILTSIFMSHSCFHITALKLLLIRVIIKADWHSFILLTHSSTQFVALVCWSSNMAGQDKKFTMYCLWHTSSSLVRLWNVLLYSSLQHYACPLSITSYLQIQPVMSHVNNPHSQLETHEKI